MHGAVAKGAPGQRFMWGWTYVVRGSALLELPIEPSAQSVSRHGACESYRRAIRPPRTALDPAPELRRDWTCVGD